jgi:hypothetical protein
VLVDLLDIEFSSSSSSSLPSSSFSSHTHSTLQSHITYFYLSLLGCDSLKDEKTVGW